MSWTFPAASGITADEFDAKVAASLAAYEHNLEASDYQLDPAASEQITAAVAAAKALVASGAVGSGTFNVTLSGHANPDHKPVKGWANDCVTVSVACADPQPAS